MYKIRRAEKLNDIIYLMEVEAPRVAKHCEPGQFIIVRIDEEGERIPLTICDYDREEGTITIVFQPIGASTQQMINLKAGDAFADFVGPLGKPSELVTDDFEEVKNKMVLFVAGGVGTAPVYPQVKWLHEHGVDADVIIGAKTKDLVILEKEMSEVAGNVYVTTDDGSNGRKGLVTDVIVDLVENQGKKYDLCVAIGPMIMMKFACLTTKKLNIPTIVSLNPIMVDGTGMCGACRVQVGEEIKFACVDGPEFDGHLVDFDQAMKRQQMYKTQEGRAILKLQEGDTHHGGCGNCSDDEKIDVLKRVPVREQDPQERAKNFDEVCLGYNEEEAVKEAKRCLGCKNAKCMQGCPVSINIPAFIAEIKERNFAKAFEIISESSALPAVCGRVCPQESQCEGKCIRGLKGEAVAIGKLERFVADWAKENGIKPKKPAETNGKRVAVIGSGPAGLTCAGDLAKLGYEVTIFEALHKTGGVLVYGIPEFRLPKDKVVAAEVENVKALGVKIETNVIIGKSVSVDELLTEEGFDAVFIGSGAGLPMFMGIPGENANGVFSANEYLTRNNLMKAFDENAETPIFHGKKVAVVGGGNVAMDAARTAIRLGAEVHIIYRRSEAELPARAEEVHHAKEEGVIFDVLTNPTEIITDENDWVKGIKLVKMELGEPDASGRRRPVQIPDSEYEMEVDAVIMSLGTSPNPLISSTTYGLDINKRKCIIADEEFGQTSKEGVFAGGDAVTGAATVILAMGAGKAAAKGIHNYLSNK